MEAVGDGEGVAGIPEITGPVGADAYGMFPTPSSTPFHGGVPAVIDIQGEQNRNWTID